MCVFTCMMCMWLVHTCHSAHMKVREQHLDINPLFSPWVLEIELRAPGLHGKMTLLSHLAGPALFIFFKKHSYSCIVWGWTVLCPISITLQILPFHVYLSSNSHVFKNLEPHLCWHLWVFFCGWKRCDGLRPHPTVLEGWKKVGWLFAIIAVSSKNALLLNRNTDIVIKSEEVQELSRWEFSSGSAT